MLKIFTVVGARPQIIKSAAITRRIAETFSHSIVETLIHTGQHYDAAMSDQFFTELGVPPPAKNLAVGSGSHGAQTAKMLTALEELFLAERPDCVLIYGDTNSTVAAALAAAKIDIPVAHVEAGMRSFDKRMPEETNRVLSDHASTFLFCPTDIAVANLVREGFPIHSERATINMPFVANIGDVMFDNALRYTAEDQKIRMIQEVEIGEKPFALVTLHRAANTVDVKMVSDLFETLAKLSEHSGLEFFFPVHPRTLSMLNKSKEELNITFENSGLTFLKPMGYRDIIWAARNAKVVITDSGGLQKEAAFFNTPSVVVRPETEWVELVEAGLVLLSGRELPEMRAALDCQIKFQGYLPQGIYGNGNAAGAICELLLTHLG